MKIETRDFGTIEIESDSVITFKLPILGFEDYRKYVLIYDQDIGENFVWLQSVEEPRLCFIMYDPSVISEFYKPEIPNAVVQALGGEEYLCWVMMTVAKDFKNSTINLKSPIFINMENHLAAQIVLEQKYPVRFQILKEDGTC